MEEVKQHLSSTKKKKLYYELENQYFGDVNFLESSTSHEASGISVCTKHDVPYDVVKERRNFSNLVAELDFDQEHEVANEVDIEAGVVGNLDPRLNFTGSAYKLYFPKHQLDDVLVGIGIGIGG
ncbi:cyclin-dependent kinase inhibitor 7-like [Forsythia ovata]|uniref:Cyclin-dependent kinase inhibitor 7-like n=1 Tax=Forsythia ovata TaxID=205694 RepID=A0ABD1VLF6_9LAMI